MTRAKRQMSDVTSLHMTRIFHSSCPYQIIFDLLPVLTCSPGMAGLHKQKQFCEGNCTEGLRLLIIYSKTEVSNTLYLIPFGICIIKTCKVLRKFNDATFVGQNKNFYIKKKKIKCFLITERHTLTSCQ